MKKCPTCNRTYADESLTYCLADGSLLSAPYDSEATQYIPLPRTTNQTKTEILPSSIPSSQSIKKADSSAFRYIVIALLALIAGVGIMAWLNSGTKETISNTSPATKSPVASNISPTSTENVIPPNPQTRPPLQITATASSIRSPMRDFTYQPSNVLDQSLATAWDEGVIGAGIGEWIRLDFDREVKLNRIIITPGYFRTPESWRHNNRLASATFYFSDGSSRHFTFPDRMIEQRLEVGGIRTRWVRMEISDVYPGSVDMEDTPISNLAFDWE